jgi:hypothetical protein
MAQDVIDFDKDKITNVDKTQQLNFVENLLSRHYDQFSDRAPHIVYQMQKESAFVRSLVVRVELEDNLRSIRALGTLRNELGYLVRLVEEDEIQEPFILEYYQKKLFDIHFIDKYIGKWN